MSDIIYQSTITQIGELAQDIVADGMLITFKQGAPADLVDYCFIHSHDKLRDELRIGQILRLGEQDYIVTAVGDVATTNLRELGHITLRFDGATIAELPGCVHVQGTLPIDLSAGHQITLINNQ
ncbi:PTS glucitol/sorbitol transporter subunit IIA [Utexia brackfieldae]|uniref:PTS glucitol/sorbitol transporter subunit IIA n=1 Tax=Utexia brackfieldae TaxID=3074108 RepID=UPI00370DCD42